MNVTLEGKATRFVGQAIPGWDIEHLGVNEDGKAVKSAHQRFEGGEHVVFEDQWIVTLTSGEQIVLRRLPIKKPGDD